MRESDKWLTAFVCDSGLYEFERAPFGLKGSGTTFVRAMDIIQRPIKSFADAFVDDCAVSSLEWDEHLSHANQFPRRRYHAQYTEVSMGAARSKTLWRNYWLWTS